MSKIVLSTITNGQNLSAINDNFNKLAIALNTNVLYRVNINTEPNAMGSPFDLNSQDLLNGGNINAAHLTVAGVELDTVVEQTAANAAQAAAAAVQANNSATAAANSASQAAGVLVNVLQKSNNLSDLPNAATARTNLGLGNVTNTSDANKPVSTAQQAALDLKANLAGANAFTVRPTFNGATPWDSSNLVFASPPAIGATTPAAVSSSSGALNGSLGSGTRNTILATTIGASGLITPASAIGIKGTATNDDAQAGSIGEVITSRAPIGSEVTLTNSTWANVTTISLTAGHWEVWGQVAFDINAATIVIQVIGSLSTVTGTPAANFEDLGVIPITPTGAAGFTALTAPAPRQVLKLSTTTTVFLVANASFTTNTCKAYGRITAVRIR